MKTKSKIVLLPGMDGTGLLFKPLIELLPDNLEVIIIRYPRDQKLDYAQLIEYVTNRLPKESFTLLAESFSGPIAYQLGLNKMLNIKKIIFVASFVTSPNPKLLAISKLLPLSLLLKYPIPAGLVKYFCLGSFTTKPLISTLREAITTVNTRVLAYRIKIMRAIKQPSMKLDIPCLNIIAKDDRLLSHETGLKISNTFLNVKTIILEGPHFLLQARPDLIANTILNLEDK